MQRRKFIHTSAFFSGGALLLPAYLRGASLATYKRHLAEKVIHPAITLPSEKRVPLGWPAFPVPVSATEKVVLTFPQIKGNPGELTFRITAAIDFREEKSISLYLPQTGAEIGTIEMRYAHPFQPFEHMIEKRWLKAVHEEGLGLRMVRGTKDAWFFMSDANRNDNLGLQPQLLTGKKSGREKIFLENLYSMNSFSPFGWMGGCVLDGLLELYRNGSQAALQTLRTQLSCFLDDKKGIIFENPRTEPLDGTFNSIEDFLPFAAINALYPGHPSIQKAVDFCMGKKNSEGLIMSGQHVTTEGCYTVAYPLAEIARHTHDAKLANIALDQLKHRAKYLSGTNSIYQRSTLKHDQAYRNWGRGAAWYLLGMAKTLQSLENMDVDQASYESIQTAFAKTIPWVADLQNENGLWYGYLDRPETTIDTSTTGGIATAIAWGCRLGLLPASYLENSERAYKALLNYLTPDGFVTHVSQINRGGEELQSSGYRVITQFGMGLLAQLNVVLGEN